MARPARRFAITEGRAPWDKRSRWLSAPPLILTTVIPVVISVGIFIAVAVWWSSNSQPTRSVALFDACVADRGYDATQSSFGSTGGEQAAAKACLNKLPAAAAQQQGGAVPSSGLAGFEQCMKSLGQSPRSSRGGGFGGFGGFHRPSQQYESAENTCRQLLAPSSPGSTTTTTQTTTTPTPAGPIE